MTHQCPRSGCTRQVPDDLLLCATDFRIVPIPLRRALYQAWGGGKGRGSDAHQAAVDAVIRFVNREPKPVPSPIELWQQAGEDPGRYRELMREHGLLLSPGDEGYAEAPKTLPCGWPGNRPVPE